MKPYWDDGRPLSTAEMSQFWPSVVVIGSIWLACLIGLIAWWSR